MGNKSVAEIVDFGVFNVREFKVSIDSGTDVSDKETAAVFGNKNMLGFGFGADFEVSG